MCLSGVAILGVAAVLNSSYSRRLEIGLREGAGWMSLVMEVVLWVITGIFRVSRCGRRLPSKGCDSQPRIDAKN